jgi:1,4-dihydroxy-2-naphthoyl-CoA hydrolase
MAATGFLSADELNALLPGTLPGLLGLVVDEHEPGRLTAHLDVRPDLLAPNGYLHAATVVGLADTACGLATRALLPEGATGFTTIELKTNFLGTAREGRITVTATNVHAGRTTQVWDAVVRTDSRTIALFRCTQSVLSPGDPRVTLVWRGPQRM